MSTHNVYLPDDLGAKAKDAGLNLSGILRAGVEDELAHREAMENIEAEVYEVYIETPEGSGITGRITGELLAEESDGSQWFLTSDGRLLYYDDRRYRVEGDLLEDPSFDVNDIGDEDARVAVAERLGLKAVVDL